MLIIMGYNQKFYPSSAWFNRDQYFVLCCLCNVCNVSDILYTILYHEDDTSVLGTVKNINQHYQ